mmetsp:Transcript_43252/g.104775  ORF Transcript_43252/g.104775 Transcript_43252/m.104775 type:complete len:373 (-) Transcript_43252:1699-2817(-)
MVAGGIGQQRRNHHQTYDHGSNGFFQQHQPTLSTASAGEKQDVVDRHPLKLHQHDSSWQPSPQIQVQQVRGDTKKEEDDFGINHGHHPPPILLQQYQHQQHQLEQVELGSHFEGTTLQGAGPDTDEFAQPQLPKRRFVLRPRPTKIVGKKDGDDQLLVSNILDGITSLCLGPTTSELFSSNLMTSNNNNKIKNKKTRKSMSNRRRCDWNGTNRSRQNQQPDRLHIQSKLPVPVVFTSFQTNMINGNEMTMMDSKLNNGSNVHNSISDANATHTTTDNSMSNNIMDNTDNSAQRRSLALIAPSSLTPSPEMLPGPSSSKRKRVVYPIASYDGSKLNCRKLVMERRQVFHQNLFRPVSNDDEMPSCGATAIVVN